MKKLIAGGVILGFAHCMGVQVPEDYMADVYYGKPKVVSVSATTSSSLSSVPVQVKFATPMNAATVNVNTTDSACTGTIQVSLATDNFATNTCLQFSSLSTENRDSLFTAVLTADIDPNTNYVVKVMNTATDFLGKSLESDGVFTFKSGVPPGTEPQVTSVGFGKKLFNNITVQFSPRPMDGNSITEALTRDCNSANAVFILTDPNGNCVNGGTNTTPGNLTTYSLNFNLSVVGNYTMVVRPGLIDQLGITTTATYTSVTVPLN